MTQTPSVGRIVHYHSYGTPGGEYLLEPRAAIITGLLSSTDPTGQTWDGYNPEGSDMVWSSYFQEMVRPEEVPEYIYAVSLCVLNPTGMFFDENVEFSETPTPGHWSWPPRT